MNMKTVNTLKLLQMGYLEAKLSKQQSENVCGLCWESHCNCNYDHKNDSFINLTAEELQYV